MTVLWLRGMLARRSGRLACAAAGIAVAVALLASIGGFLACSKSAMTKRAARGVAVDWQVEVQPGADVSRVLATTSRAAGVQDALAVGLALTSGLESTTNGTTHTTGPGRVLGIPAGYRETFPLSLRTLAGRGTGVLLAPQTAARLHAGPGDTVLIGRTGLPPVRERVDGVVELPKTDSLFQKVGASPQSWLQAPPGNVVLLPSTEFKKILAPLALSRPDLVSTQIHVRRTRALPADPAAAFTQVSTAANSLEAQTAGAALVDDNLGAALDSARADALYSRALFLFLGVPGAALAAALTAVIAGAGAVRRRRDQALLRTRGGSRSAVLRLAMVEASVVGVVGSLLGLAAAAAAGTAMFGSPGFGTTAASGAVWALVTAAIGLLVAMAVVLLPVRRDLRDGSIAAGHGASSRERQPRWMRHGLDLALIAAALVIFYATTRHHQALVVAPEGAPTISVNYWALLEPALLWAGSGLLAWRLADAALTSRTLLSRGLRPIAGNLSGTVASAISHQRDLLARAIVLMTLAIAFAASTATFNATYNQRDRLRHIPGTIASPLTAVDLAGLTKVELAFALVLVAAASGLVLGLGLVERRRSLAMAAALGADRRQLRSFVTSEATVVTIGGLVGGAAAGWALTNMLLKVLMGDFDPQPAHLAVPWASLLSVLLIASGAMAAAASVATRMALQPAMQQLREL